MVADVRAIGLGTLLGEIRRESRKNRADKRRLSHALANGLIEILQVKGAILVEPGPGNANYFCSEIDGVQVAVSPFAFHDGWWGKVSDGFRSLGKRRGCRWGVALFNLPDERGVWFEDEDYDLHVLRSHETVNKIDAQRAERLGIGHSLLTRSFFDYSKRELKGRYAHGSFARPRRTPFEPRSETVSILVNMNTRVAVQG